MNLKRISNNEILWFSLAAILIGVALRWPLTNHEGGIDSFYIHTLANSIVREGTAPWLITPLNFFGAYEMSYPAGYPIIIGEMAQMTGISVEAVILLCTFACGAIASMASFVLALEIRREPFFAFAISVAYSTAPLILSLTTWTATTRGIFMSLLPLTIWLLIKTEKLRGIESARRMRMKLLVILLIDLVMMMSLHRLAFMLIIFVFAYLIWRAIDSRHLSRKVMRFGTRRWSAVRVVVILLVAVPIAISTVLASYYAGFFNFESFGEGTVQGDSVITPLINIIAPIGLTVGYPLAFAFPLAILFIAKDRRLEFLTVFFILSFLLLLPFAGSRIYDKPIYPSIVLPLMLLSIVGKAWPRLRRSYRKIVVVAIALTLPMNLFFVVEHYQNWPEGAVVNDGNSLSEESYSTSLFAVHYLDGEEFVGNNWIASMRFQAISDCFELPNALGPTEATNLLLSGLMTKDDMNYRLNSLQDILNSLGTLYTTEWDHQPQIDWVMLFLYTGNIKSSASILKQYNVTLMIEDARITGKITGWQSSLLYPEGTAESPFMVSVHSSMYKIYDNGREYLWLIAV